MYFQLIAFLCHMPSLVVLFEGRTCIRETSLAQIHQILQEAVQAAPPGGELEEYIITGSVV